MRNFFKAKVTKALEKIMESNKAYSVHESAPQNEGLPVPLLQPSGRGAVYKPGQ